MAFLIIDSTIFTPSFYLVPKEIFDQVKALPFDNHTATMEQYRDYLNAIQNLIQPDGTSTLNPGVEHFELETYSNLSLGSVEGVFAINGG